MSKELEEHVRMVADFYKGQRKSPAKFMLKHGRSFHFDNKSFAGKKGTPKYCYANTFRRVMADSSLTYVEGYVLFAGIPIEHAWAVDRTGHVIETTIRHPKDVMGYFGVPMKTEYVVKATSRTGLHGVFGDLKFRWLDDDPQEIIAEIECVAS